MMDKIRGLGMTRVRRGEKNKGKGALGKKTDKRVQKKVLLWILDILRLGRRIEK